MAISSQDVERVHMAMATLAKCAEEGSAAAMLLQLGVAEAITAGLAAGWQLHPALADVALVLLGSICSSSTQLEQLQGTGGAGIKGMLAVRGTAANCRRRTPAELDIALTATAARPAHAGMLQRAAQVLLQCPTDSRTSLWARLALCAACRHDGCAQELLGLGFGSVLASLVGRGGGCIQGRGLAAGALVQLAGNAQLAGSLCTGGVVQRLVLEVATAAAALAASAGASTAAIEAEELDMVLQLCSVLAALSALPSGRAQLAAAASVLAQVFGVVVLPASGQRQELLMQLGCEAGALLSRLLRSPDAGPALLQQQPRLAGLLLQLPCCELTADVQEAAVSALEAAVGKDPGLR